MLREMLGNKQTKYTRPPLSHTTVDGNYIVWIKWLKRSVWDA